MTPDRGIWRCRAVALVVLTVALGIDALRAPALRAQAASDGAAPALVGTDSLPFRAGQWGAEFGLGTYTSLGLLRFRSPARAWVGTVSGVFDRVSPDDGGPSFTNSNLNVSFGHRWYRPVLPGVAQFATVGGVVRRSESVSLVARNSFPGPTDPIVNRLASESLSAGLTADVGAQWMVTPSLSLGAQWGAQALFGRERSTVPAGVNVIQLDGGRTNLVLGRVAVVGTLFF